MKYIKENEQKCLSLDMRLHILHNSELVIGNLGSSFNIEVLKTIIHKQSVAHYVFGA